jgi:CMP-N-acetylneuraminic acid synthetase
MFAGRPLVAWSIIQALCSRTLDEVWVSSDSERILEVASKLGARTYKREREENDDAPGYVPMLELIKKIADPRDIFVGLMATSPLRMPDDIDKAVGKWCNSPDREHKLLNTMIEIHEDFRFKLMNDDYAIPLPPSEHNNLRVDGSIHVSTRAMYEEDIESEGDVYFIPYLIQPWQGLDINNADQLRFAEMVFYDRILKDNLNPYEVYKKGGLNV